MTTTVSDLVNDTKRVLYGSHRTSLNKSTSTVTTTQTSIACTYPVNFGAGSYLGIDDEVVYVYTTDSASNSANAVERGMMGTTAAQHAASALIDVEPRFTRQGIKDALQDDIRSWPRAVYQVETLIPSVGTNDREVDLTGIDPNFYTILEVRHSPLANVPMTFDTWPEIRNFDVNRSADPTDFPSGVGLILPTTYITGMDLRVVVASPFDVSTFDDATSLSSAVGLESTMLDIPPLGAVWRLMHGREIKRTFTEGQGEVRRAAEVPPRFITATADDYRKRRDLRLEDETRRLAGRFPMRGI